MEKSENIKFLEAIASEKGITDPEKIKDFMLQTVLGWIAV